MPPHVFRRLGGGVRLPMAAPHTEGVGAAAMWQLGRRHSADQWAADPSDRMAANVGGTRSSAATCSRHPASYEV